MNCKTCDGGLDEFEEFVGFEKCFDDIISEPENHMTRKHLFKAKKNFYKKKLHKSIKECNFNGLGMRLLITEFSEEVLGS